MRAVMLLGVLLSQLFAPQTPSADPWYNPPQLTGFPVTLSGEPAEYSSVVLGDLDRDGKDEIVFAGRDGWIPTRSRRMASCSGSTTSCPQ